MGKELTKKIEDLTRSVCQAEYILSKDHCRDLARGSVRELMPREKACVPGQNFQLLRVDKIVYDDKENNLDKLTTVYSALSAFSDTALVTIIHGSRTETQLYCGVVYRGNEPDGRKRGFDLFDTVLHSNFPGISAAPVPVDEWKEKDGKRGICNPALLENIFPPEAQASTIGKRPPKYVSAITGVAAPRREEFFRNEEYIQGLERLMDAMRGKEYTVILLADCLSQDRVTALRQDYEDIATRLSPFAQLQKSVSKAAGLTDTAGFSSGLSESVNHSVSHSDTHTESESSTHTVGVNASVSKGVQVGASAEIVSVSESLGFNMGASYSYAKSKSKSDAHTDGETDGWGATTSLQESLSRAVSLTETEGLQITVQNQTVKGLLDRVEEQIKRLRACQDFGLFDFGAYFIADERAVAEAAAANYQALMRGENSSIEASALNTWSGADADKIMSALRRFSHPSVLIPDFSQPPLKDGRPAIAVSPTSLVSGRELAIHMGLPKRSVPGVAVDRCAEFARQVLTLDGAVTMGMALGHIVHMRAEDKEQKVLLNRKSLTGHTFITGSTGSGKSNTVYWMLDQLTRDEDVHFMVIEPAKGEYKDAFGGRKDVSVYGTNPRRSPLLRLNPFSFPCKGDNAIHVLEHLDRLVEVFNACWPMYAAMPAVLKDAMERAYQACGWSLIRSEWAGKEPRFPGFDDLLAQLPVVMDSSDYSADTKGNYKGALLTRLKSLTNGINGQIFCAERELSGEELFDGNVIVDLSRVGSSETKALLMGVLMIKLQEHRMACADGADRDLRHITVLEEAHNLLRRTSAEQSQEGSNLQGKAVEMLTNAIAEMRTYGEGFIIADQAPGLLDMAAIRNTNTKIIMRLPDQGDRELVGKAAGLNDEQVAELAKLDTGVAAVYQNGWLEPALCKVEEFKDRRPYSGQPDAAVGQASPLHETFVRALLEGGDLGKALKDEDVDALCNWLERLEFDSAKKSGEKPDDMKSWVIARMRGAAPAEHAQFLYVISRGRTLLTPARQGDISAAAAAAMDQQLQDRLRISSALAEQVRVALCTYMAELCSSEQAALRQRMEQFGGVKHAV